MTDRLKLYNGALRLCGHSKLSTLTDNVEARRLLDDVFDDDFVDKVLEAGLWNFALRAQALTPDPSVTPPFGYSNAFLKTDDWIRTAAVCDDEFFRSPLLDYQDETDFIYTELINIWVRFVSNDASFGGDLSKWPGSFQEYGEAFLASKIIHRLTSDKERILLITERRKGILDRSLRDSRSKDAMESPTRFIPTGTWVSSRGRGRRRGPFGDRGVTGSLTG